MKKQDLMKFTYKNEVTADLMQVNKSGIKYTALIDGNAVFFLIPYEDIGDASFLPKMEAKQLVRWYQEPKND